MDSSLGTLAVDLTPGDRSTVQLIIHVSPFLPPPSYL